ncbi:hypothetical protein JR316_0007393 [Psilocybe cubensis]|uniref:Uncharacterized protein n=2 Tax=Psilocybe cubensis TaxID=181762 RepID=A0A8H7XSP8_PSICU|nr:hypothetical protein JR316_0007393 [Psilocybe cubensis]KAH9480793.1 hypothetical protein JR316_0007393 [Psilocybe cubensis]
MRIITLPLTTGPARISAAAAANQTRFTYFDFQSPINALQSASVMPATSRWLPNSAQISSLAAIKAASVWSEFGKAEGGWKLKAYETGQALIDKTDFEELALRSFNPSDINCQDTVKIPLIYPPSVFPPSASAVLAELQAHIASRIELHKKGLYLWSAAIPPTLPLKLIPIIPNFPFFYSAWRAWSHYQAKTSAEYLQSLLKHNAIVPEASSELDEIYLVRRQRLTIATAESDIQRVILTHDDIPSLVLFCSVDSASLKRAIEQVADRLGRN